MSYVTYENSAFTGTTAVYKMANDKIESYARAYSNASSATRNSAQEFFVAQKWILNALVPISNRSEHRKGLWWESVGSMVAEMVSASVELGKASGKKPKDILSRECVFSETSGVFDEFATVSGFSKKPRETGVGNMRENFSFVAKDMHSALNAVAKK